MAFMMPVVKNDWDIYNSQKSRRTSESADRVGGGGRVRKVSESRSEGPGTSPRSVPLSPHRSAPAMRSLSYSRPPASRASLRAPQDNHMQKGSGSPVSARGGPDKFHNRLVEKLRRAFRPERGEERTSWAKPSCCVCREQSPDRSRCLGCVPYLWPAPRVGPRDKGRGSTPHHNSVIRFL